VDHALGRTQAGLHQGGAGSTEIAPHLPEKGEDAGAARPTVPGRATAGRSSVDGARRQESDATSGRPAAAQPSLPSGYRETLRYPSSLRILITTSAC
jgi:hypothetical protein